MTKKQKLLCVVLTALCLFGLFCGMRWTLYSMHYESNELADLSWSSSGESMCLRVTVRDAKGYPLSGVHVDSVSYSGRAGNANLTDHDGKVTIRPAEHELIGLDINGVTVFERAMFFAPSVAEGLEMTVDIKNKARLKIDSVRQQEP